jgi:hypothetical protein
MTNRRRKLTWGIGTVLVVLGIVGTVVHRRPGGWDLALYEAQLSYFDNVPPLTWPRDAFSPEAWKQTPPDGRYRFAKSLLSSKQLIGRTPSEVDRLLGGMRADRLGCLDHVANDETDCDYSLRRVGFQSLWWVLELKFKDGRVVEARRILAFIDR